jgi:hypothetical protein
MVGLPFFVHAMILAIGLLRNGSVNSGEVYQIVLECTGTLAFSPNPNIQGLLPGDLSS